MLDGDDIRRLIPHRPPMLLVDRVSELVPRRHLVGSYTVTGSHPLPPVLLLESWGQAALVLIRHDRPMPDVLTGGVPVAGVFEEIRFGRPVWPGETVEHRVRLTRLLADTGFVEGETVIGSEVVMRVGRLVGAVRPAATLRPAALAGVSDGKEST
ncbi:3-hydroxyacyl-ACP dehydratase FabZ family protein [Micromonospora sp. DT48]|uniref:3-hydroxyacyl-ACP dehydratase FabZ family protein n=1 Tax=unclassified Micromonospora TaxID=2617518 RepID=UPI0012BCAE35|nr:beta-hydroxyacyl-ACP dehydratase [Micromonospora sp. CP22]MTK04791.1 beta-hydroxyacyl-ACP dehydratase [Micromonospora sp. CP22]